MSRAARVARPGHQTPRRAGAARRPIRRFARRSGLRFDGGMPKLTRQQRRAQERSAAKRARAVTAGASPTPGTSRPFLLRTRTLLAIVASTATIATAAY